MNGASRSRGIGAKEPGYDPVVKVVVHDRTEGVPVQVRAYAEDRLRRVARHFDRIVEAEVEFAKEAGRRARPDCEVQITVRMDGRRHPLAQARERATDARAALDLALDKVDRQVVRLKEKIRVEKKRVSAHEGDGDGEPEILSIGLERIRMRLRPQTLAEAEAALDVAPHPFYVFLDEGSGEVNVCFRRNNGGLAVIETVVL